MDRKDLEILKVLQEDATVSLAELAESVNLSSTPCWRRVQKLRDEGVIRRQVVLCDPGKLNVGLSTFVLVRTSHHDEAWMTRFVEAANGIPEIVEIYRMSGDIDYLLKIVVPDMAGYDGVYKRLIAAVDLLDVSATFAMEVIKSSTALPLEYALGG
jgi:Lrp/AsnC family transcriptional regulator